MAIERNWRAPATMNDGDYKINATTLAAMVEIKKGKMLEETGKQSRKMEYKDIIRSDELEQGIIISAENTIKDREEK